MTRAGALTRAAAAFAVAFLLIVSHGPAAAGGESATSLDLSAHRGKVVVIDFWASWCVPCRRSLPWFDAVQRKYREQGLVIIGVNEDQNPADAAAFLADYPVGFRIVADRDGEIAREYELIAMPSTYVVGRDGTVVARHLGFKTAKQDEYEALLRDLLEDGPAAAGER